MCFLPNPYISCIIIVHGLLMIKEASLSSRDVQEWDKAVKCFLFEFWDMELVDLKKMLPGLPARIQGWCSYMAQGARVCFIR